MSWIYDRIFTRGEIGKILSWGVFCEKALYGSGRARPGKAVNHSGDSDSTGSITGAMLGTLRGVEAIPERWIRGVENLETIQKIAIDMYRIFREGETLSFEASN